MMISPFDVLTSLVLWTAVYVEAPPPQLKLPQFTSVTLPYGAGAIANGSPVTAIDTTALPLGSAAMLGADMAHGAGAVIVAAMLLCGMPVHAGLRQVTTYRMLLLM